MAGFSIGKVIKNGVSALSQSAETVVRAFCDAWEQRDLERVLGLMAEDVAYQNVPQPVMQGRAQARRFLGPILRQTRAIKLVVLNLLVSEQAVLVLTDL